MMSWHLLSFCSFAAGIRFVISLVLTHCMHIITLSRWRRVSWAPSLQGYRCSCSPSPKACCLWKSGLSVSFYRLNNNDKNNCSLPLANMKNGNDTQSPGLNLSDKEMTQFKLDPQTSIHFCESSYQSRGHESFSCTLQAWFPKQDLINPWAREVKQKVKYETLYKECWTVKKQQCYTWEVKKSFLYVVLWATEVKSSRTEASYTPSATQLRHE